MALLLAASLAAAGCAQVDKGVQRVTGRTAAVTAPVCQDFTFPLYFQTGSDQLTPDGLAVVDSFAARVKACPVAELKVAGLADAEGGALNNLELSQRRATAVAAILAARGYPTPTFEVAASGDAGATTAAGRREPLRRRAEVSVRFAAATPTP
jgi:outer membrane protein OmpA-like peptidoglycan-associated protein